MQRFAEYHGGSGFPQGISLWGRVAGAEGATRRVAAVERAETAQKDCPTQCGSPAGIRLWMNWQQAAANSIWARIELFLVVDHVRRLGDPGQLCGELR
jgi:hypothetical protein